jgi:hypothetical protein
LSSSRPPFAAPVLGQDGSIVEGLVTTLGPNGAPHLAPMGPIVDERFDHLWLRPYKTSTTYKNLKRTGAGVFHITDDVELLARATIGQAASLPSHRSAESVAGVVLTNACRWFEFEVETLDDASERTCIVAGVVNRGTQRDFVGFNRAKHAVVEAAILASRVHLLEAEKLNAEFDRLAVPLEKTGAAAEHRAFAMLRDYVRNAVAERRP